MPKQIGHRQQNASTATVLCALPHGILLLQKTAIPAHLNGVPRMLAHGRIMRALLIAISIVLISIKSAAAQWPTTCVELNDTFEARLGNFENIGIYQRTFGDQAEQACRNDHREDVLDSFAWALDEAESDDRTIQSTPQSPESNVAFESVRNVALARGADDHVATAVAVAVVTGGNVDSYLRGTHANIPYGEFACDWLSTACPLAPPVPYETVDFRWRWIEQEGPCWRLAMQFGIANNMAEWLSFVWADISAIDQDGFEIDKTTIFDIDVAPQSTRHFSESWEICGGLGPSVAALRISYE